MLVQSPPFWRHDEVLILLMNSASLKVESDGASLGLVLPLFLSLVRATRSQTRYINGMGITIMPPKMEGKSDLEQVC